MYVKLAINTMCDKISRSILSIILSVIGTLVIIFTIVQGIGTNYAYKSIDDVLTTGINKTIRLRLSDLNDKFVDELLSQPEICSAGEIVKYQMIGLNDLLLKQNELTHKDNSMLNVITLSKGALKLCNLSLQQGELEVNFPHNGVEYLYLGADFNNIPIGTIYRTENTTYIVKGIMEKGQRFIEPELSVSFDQNKTDYTFNCDSSVFAVVPFTFTDGLWVSAADDYTVDDVISKMFDVAENNGVKIKYRTLEKSYSDAMINVMTVKAIFSKLMPIVSISCLIIILCTQLLDTFSNTHNFGIMYTQGFLEKDIRNIIIIKSVIVFGTSLVLSMPLITLIVNWWYKSSDSNFNDINMMLIYNTIPIAIMSLVFTALISILISFIYLRTLTPVKMIGEDND